MINKNLLNELIKTQDLQNLEKEFVCTYLSNKKIDFSASPILSAYFEDFTQNPLLHYKLCLLNINSIKDLENCLELLIPNDDRKFNGAFFTPGYIIDFIINEVRPGFADTNIDPSCGCGAFLVGLADYYRRAFDKPVRQIVRENIFGADILAYNIRRTKLVLAVYALQHGEVLQESDFNLYCQDSLKTNWSQEFTNVVGNPPYVKFQDLSNESRAHLAQKWATVEGGTFNLYFAFFELGYQLLQPNGKLGYITPNNYFTSLAGESLRKFFQQKKCVSRIIDFNDKKVFDAQTYTAITFLSKQTNEAITFDRIKENYTPENFLASANGSPNYLQDLNPKKWRLLKTEERDNIKTIETIGTPIGKLFDISVGIATLKDDVFFVDGKSERGDYLVKTSDKGIFEIEKAATKSVYKISDFKNQTAVKENSRRIIFPYTVRHGVATPIPEAQFKQQFPKCYAYLVSARDILLSRDKGKIAFEPFYVWGRTQGLTKFGKRLLTPTFSRNPRFLAIEETDSFFTNGYGIFCKNDHSENSLFANETNPINRAENMDIVQKILNSYIMQYYISRTSVSIEGGYPCYQKNFIENFTIPMFTADDINSVRRIQSEHEIDAFLIGKYQLKLHLPNLSA